MPEQSASKNVQIEPSRREFLGATLCGALAMVDVRPKLTRTVADQVLVYKDQQTIMSPAGGELLDKKIVSAGTNVQVGDRLGFIDNGGALVPVVAHSNGIVVSWFHDPGKKVMKGDELVVIADPGMIGLSVSLPKGSPDPKLAVNDTVTVKIQISKDEVETRPAVVTSAEFDKKAGKFKFEVLLPNEQVNDEWIFRPGMKSSIQIAE